jgi:hypothetical protein
VRITALIYDISLQDIEKLGINWQHRVGSSVEIDSDGTRTRDSAFNIDSIMQVPFQEGTVGGTMQLLSLSRHLDIGAIVLALQGCSDARLLADPNVAVLENEEAVFQSVSEIPYQQLTETQQGGSIGTTAFKQAGITLKVRPKIAADGVIQMEVTPEFSRLTGFTPGDNQPIIDVRSASTVLTVANRQTVVIGGLRQRSDIGDFQGVPYLKDLKLVGRLFRSRDTDVRESELVVFIMPEIIHCADKHSFRQQLVEDTIRCRLDQIPEAEGCPPCCRRLPMDPAASYSAPLDLQQEDLPVENSSRNRPRRFTRQNFNLAPPDDRSTFVCWWPRARCGGCRAPIMSIRRRHRATQRKPNRTLRQTRRQRRYTGPASKSCFVSTSRSRMAVATATITTGAVRLILPSLSAMRRLHACPIRRPTGTS